MAGDRSPQPPREAWEGWKEQIRGWYLAKNLTCAEIKKQLWEQGFHVSERQIKNRLSEWKLEQKKTPSRHYLAMMTVSNYYKARGAEIEFDVPKRETRQIFNSQKVKKECERVRKRCISRRDDLEILSVEAAAMVLKDANILYHVRQPVVQHRSINRVRPYEDVGLRPGNNLARPNMRPPSLSASAMETSAIQLRFTSTASEQRLATQNLSIMSILGCYPELSTYHHFSLPVSGSITYALESIDTTTRLSSLKIEPTPLHHIKPSGLASHGEFSHLATATDSAQRTYTQNSSQGPHKALLSKDLTMKRCKWNLEEDTFSSSPDVMSDLQVQQRPSDTKRPDSENITCSKYDQLNQTPTVNFSLDGALVEGQDPMPACENPHTNTDSGYISNSDSIGRRDSMSGSETSSQSSPADAMSLTQESEEDYKLTASRWATPYCAKLAPDASEDFIKNARMQSMESLKHALETSNKFLLPCLSWTILMLGHAERVGQLVEFLDDSCTIIEEYQRANNSSRYAAPFQHARAWAKNNTAEMLSMGAQLHNSYIRMRSQPHDEHPNTFACAFLYAWHLLHQGYVAEAIELLDTNLPSCELQMGNHDLLTICCLSIAARAHQTMQNWERARHCFLKAMRATCHLEAEKEHSPSCRLILQRHRLSLLERYGHMSFDRHDYKNAEKEFWRLLHLRGELYGPETAETWDAFRALKKVLQITGKLESVRELDDYMLRWYCWEQQKLWYLTRGSDFPPPPLPPSCWWEFRTPTQTRPDCKSRWDPMNIDSRSTLVVSS